MTTQETTTIKLTVNGAEEKWHREDLAAYVGLGEEQVNTLPKYALGKMVEANRKAENAQAQAEKNKGASRTKETPREKLLKKAESKMGAGVEKMLDHVVNGTRYDKETDYSTTDQYMADRYGPVVLAVLYKYGGLSQTVQDRVEAMYPNHND